MSMTAPHIMVLAGGLSHEREISLRSGARVAQALRSTGCEVSVRDSDSSLLTWIEEHHPAAAVIALHGGHGENGSVQAVLEMSRVPFVGTRAAECRLAWDKATAKVLLDRAGFSTPRWVTVSHQAFHDLGAAGLVAAVADHLTFPLVLKPLQGGSALGVSVVHSVDELPSALVGSFAYGEELLIEEYVRGTEVAVAVVEDDGVPTALPPVEIVSPGEIFDYDAHYTAGVATYYAPARLAESAATAVGDLALAVHHELGLKDVSRTDVIVAPDGTAQFLEVNVSPGLTETSTVPMAVTTADRSLGGVYRAFVDRAIGNHRA